MSIEREVGTLVLMREERMTKSSWGRSTASLVQRMNFRRRKIRQLLSQWEAWHMFMQPDDYEVTPYEEENVWAGTLPWQPTNLVENVIKAALELAMYKVQSEMARTREELQFLRHDVRVLLAYYQRQQLSLMSTVLELGAGGLTCSMAHLLRSKLRQVRSCSMMQRLALRRLGCYERFQLKACHF